MTSRTRTRSRASTGTGTDRVPPALEETLRIPADRGALDGDLLIPAGARGLVLFAHGSGSSRLSPRNRFVARELRARGLGTLLFDLLTEEEGWIDARTSQHRFDIDLLAGRLIHATKWVEQFLESQHATRVLGYFGASTGAAAALVAAAHLGRRIGAVVSRGGRPDLAGSALRSVTSPTLLIVGGDDRQVLQLNEDALAQMTCERRLEVVPGATHLFEEPGALEEVAGIAAAWFAAHLNRNSQAPAARASA